MVSLRKALSSAVSGTKKAVKKGRCTALSVKKNQAHSNLLRARKAKDKVDSAYWQKQLQKHEKKFDDMGC